MSRNILVGSKVDVIVLDVDSKDTTTGMSCPPKPFTEIDFVKDLRGCLSETGYYTGVKPIFIVTI